MRIVFTQKLDQWTPKLKAMISTLGPEGKRAVLGAAGDELRGITLEQFGSDRANRAAPWPDLSKRYQKRIKYFGPPKLILTGALQQSLSLTVDTDVAWVTANSPYAAAQQFGRPGKNLPARPFFPVVANKLTDYARQRILGRIMRVLGQLTRK